MNRNSSNRNDQLIKFASVMFVFSMSLAVCKYTMLTMDTHFTLKEKCFTYSESEATECTFSPSMLSRNLDGVLKVEVLGETQIDYRSHDILISEGTLHLPLNNNETINISGNAKIKHSSTDLKNTTITKEEFYIEGEFKSSSNILGGGSGSGKIDGGMTQEVYEEEYDYQDRKLEAFGRTEFIYDGKEYKLESNETLDITLFRGDTIEVTKGTLEIK